MKVRFLHARFFLWLIVPALFYALVPFTGLPHARWAHAWIDEGQGFDPFAARRYTHCVFIGPYGRFDVFPSDGSCAWIRFYRPKLQQEGTDGR